MASVTTRGYSQVEASIVDDCNYEEGKGIDQTNCSVVVKSSIGFPEALPSVEVEEFEGHYGSDQECGNSDHDDDSDEIQNLSASQSSLIEINSVGSDGSKQGDDVVTPEQSCSIAMSQCSSLGRSETLLKKTARENDNDIGIIATGQVSSSFLQDEE